MIVYGVDFTSTPSSKKAITCLKCELQGDHLVANTLYRWSSFKGFEEALCQPGPWIMGIDFPFGLARRFIETIGWHRRWENYVDHAASMSRAQFKTTLKTYSAGRAQGDKEHRRRTDIHAGSLSPQKLKFAPVGLMFHEGAPRLRRAGVMIPGMQRGDPQRIVVEAYPGVLVRRFIERQPYKNGSKKKQIEDQRDVRQKLLQHLLSSKLQQTYRLRLKAPVSLIEDPTGDSIDALGCAIQAGWAWSKRHQRYGAPRRFDPLEGWIADPSTSG